MKKKLVVIVTVILGLSAVSSAQPRAIGGRLTGGAEVSYQHQMNSDNFIEVDLGWVDAFNVVGIYDFMIAQPAWTRRGEWGFYAGPGIALGSDDNFCFGVAGQVGLEYTFWFPLQLSFDFRPQIGLVNKDFGWWGWYPALGVRYRF